MKTMFAVVFCALSPAAFAGEPRIVDVDTRNVAHRIAKNINVDPGQIPVIVPAPVDVAADVCNVAEDVLAEQVAGDAGSCTAEITSIGLDQIVQQQMRAPTQE